MRANTTVIGREIDMGWIGDGGTGCIQGWPDISEGFGGLR
jgi:hypothetical protein